MTDMDGDGVAIAALSGPFGGGDDVSAVDIIGCKFLNCGRSGVSNQRLAEFVRIHQCHFEGTSDQDIDFEPTGAELDTGPRRYSIMGNTMIHSGGTASVTLSGVGGDIPARDNIFAYNQVYGGRVGMLDTENVLIVGNYVEGSLRDTGPVLQLRGKSEGARISQNHLVRPCGRPGHCRQNAQHLQPGVDLRAPRYRPHDRHTLVLVDHPSGVDVSQNRLHSHSSADEDGCTVLITNAQRCSFTDNEVASYTGTMVSTAVRFVTSTAIRTPVDDWNICQNRIRGDAGHDGTYDTGVTAMPWTSAFWHGWVSGVD